MAKSSGDVQFTQNEIQIYQPPPSGLYPNAYLFGMAPAKVDGITHLVVSDASAVKYPTGDTAGKYHDLSNVYWLQNEGDRGFTPYPMMHTPQRGMYEHLAVGDINDDGHLDVVVVKNIPQHLDPDKIHVSIVWFQNHGDPRRGPDNWTEHPIAAYPDFRAYDVVIAPLSGHENYPDIAASSFGNGFAWFENPGKGKVDNAARWTMNKLFDGDGKTPFGHCRMIRAAKFSSSGWWDLVGTEDASADGSDFSVHTVVVFKNQGHVTDPSKKFERFVIDGVSPYPMHGQPADVDGDGVMDLVLAMGYRSPLDPGTKPPGTNRIVWYKNRGDGTKWDPTPHFIGDLEWGFEAVADFLVGDGDRFPDVVAIAQGDGVLDKSSNPSARMGKLVWYKNPGSGGGKWIEHTLLPSFPAACKVVTANLRRDRKRVDIAASSAFDTHADRGHLYWWRNDGPA